MFYHIEIRQLKGELRMAADGLMPLLGLSFSLELRGRMAFRGEGWSLQRREVSLGARTCTFIVLHLLLAVVLPEPGLFRL